jgi:hypothetical protein
MFVEQPPDMFLCRQGESSRVHWISVEDGGKYVFPITTVFTTCCEMPVSDRNLSGYRRSYRVNGDSRFGFEPQHIDCPVG